MRFAFSDEQVELRRAVRDLLAKECPPGVVRRAWTNETGRTEGAWKALVGMGVLGVLAPEASGGLGGDEVDLVGVLEETGRAALPEPIVETAAVAVPLLAEAGDHRAEGLVAGGGGATAIAPTDELAVWADTADLVVRFDDTGVHAVATAEVGLDRRSSVDGARRLHHVDGRLDDSTRVGGPDVAALAFDRGALGTAAQLLGLGWRLLEVTVDYAKQREQFGVPIGSFQAVKHHLANVRMALEFAAPLVYRAAWSVAHRDAERSVHVSMAKAHASDAATLATRVALQGHGAIGYTTEHDLHLWMKRAWALRAAWGSAAWHRRRVGRAIL
ncbi:MAG: acyl-CoA dehydrogenase family protein [Acidimicrobiia bacterium]|nr:acyl-CoA dehydrogenase family protein [Acidimicrobiia bacterium]